MQRTLLFLAYLLICTGCLAQQYPFIFYTPKNGLVNSRVRKMYQDSKGRLYFITFGGLSVYDGARFRNYTKLNGLASDMINDVVEAGEDSFLVASNTSKMNVLVNGQIKDFPSEDNYCPVINHLLKSTEGHIYLTADEGLFLLDNKKFRKLSFNMPGSPEIPPFLGDIVECGDMLLIGTNDLRNFTGLYLYDKKNKRLADSMSGIVINTFAKDKRGQVWISLADRTYMLDTGALKKGRLQLTSLPGSYRYISNFVTSAIAFDENNAWLIHNGREIIKAGNDGSLLQIRMPDNGQGSDKIFVDKENIVWVSNQGTGAFKLVSTALQIDETILGNARGLISQASYKKDTTWFILNYKQLVRRTPSGTKKFTVSNQKDIPLIYSARQINGRLIVFDEKNIYAASVTSVTEGKIHLSKLLTLPSSNGGVYVTDPYGNLIITEARHITVIQKDRIIFRYPIAVSDLVQSMQFDDHGRLWAATRGEGLIVLSLHPDDPLRYLQLIHNFKTELGGLSPRTMILDKKGLIWVGTRNDGLLAFTYENGKLKKLLHVQTQQGLTDNYVTSLACDSAGNIIAGTQTGLDRLVATTNNEYRIENVTKSNGIFGFISTTWVDSRNHCYALFNNNAVLQITPLSASQVNYQPQLFFEEIKVNGATINPSVRNQQFSYTQRNLSFNVAAPAFVDEQQIKYSYLLEGSGNKEWSEASGNAGINFVNLPPGQYRLQVKASFPSTSYASRKISWPFEIVPPWWQRTWFQLILAVSIIAVVILIIRFYYVQELKKRMRILEKQQAIEKERTRIATDMHDDLGAGLSRIKFLSETIGIKKQQQQPIEEDINKIKEYSHDMIDKMGEIVWALNEKNDSLSDLLAYTRAYAVEYLSQNDIQCTVEAPEQFPSLFVSGEFRRNIYLTVKEALHNIVKHAHAGHVKIRIDTSQHLFISISDDGMGIDKSTIRPFSNGLANMKKRIESIGGELEIESGKGVTVRLSVPL